MRKWELKVYSDWNIFRVVLLLIELDISIVQEYITLLSPMRVPNRFPTLPYILPLTCSRRILNIWHLDCFRGHIIPESWIHSLPTTELLVRVHLPWPLGVLFHLGHPGV